MQEQISAGNSEVVELARISLLREMIEKMNQSERDQLFIQMFRESFQTNNNRYDISWKCSHMIAEHFEPRSSAR